MKAWWRHRTLRFRLALWYGAGGALLLAGFSATLYFYVAQTMARPLDHQLREDLAEVRRRLAVTAEGALRWDGSSIATDAQWDPENPWFELWNEEGRLVCRFWPFPEHRVESVPPAPEPGRDRISIFNVARDLRLRVLSVPYQVPSHGKDWMIRVLMVHRPMADALVALRLIIVFALPVVITLLVVGGYVFTRHWLRPLDTMVAAADLITSEDLGRRLPVQNPHDELGRLAVVFNFTLDRLEASFVTLDRFVADASHELRTPLTTLRSVGEVGLRKDRTVEEYREIIGSMLEEAQRLQLLTQRLLELASAEGGESTLPRRHVRLDEYVVACVGELGVLAEHKNQRLAVETVPCTANTDPVLFRQALQNLVDNAIKYSPNNSTIRIGVRMTEGLCRVEVTDEGPGISPEHRIQLMARFFRPDSGRDRGRGGFGLGLSITKAYMRVLGGTLEHEPAKPRGSTFRLTLPAA
ncbi:MAG: HAMP domain-containing protein [Opitutus sp.]|nr:HAMP domain-containing protein [Opitutus sp.]